MSSWPEPNGVVNKLSSLSEDRLAFAQAFNLAMANDAPIKNQLTTKALEILKLSKFVPENPLLKQFLALLTVNDEIDSKKLEDKNWLVHFERIKLLNDILKSPLNYQELEQNLAEFLLIEIKLITPALLKDLRSKALGLIDEAKAFVSKDESQKNRVLLVSLLEFFLIPDANSRLTLTSGVALEFIGKMNQLGTTATTLKQVPDSLKEGCIKLIDDLKPTWLTVSAALKTIETRTDYLQLSVSEPLPLEIDYLPEPIVILAKEVLEKLKNQTNTVGFIGNNLHDTDVVEQILSINNFYVIEIDVDAYISNTKTYRDLFYWFRSKEIIDWLAEIINKNIGDNKQAVVVLRNIASLKSIDKNNPDILNNGLKNLLSQIKNAQVLIPVNQKLEKPLAPDLKKNLLKKETIDLFVGQKVIDNLTTMFDSALGDYKKPLSMIAKVARALLPSQFSSGAFYSLVKSFEDLGENNNKTVLPEQILNTNMDRAYQVLFEYLGLKDFILFNYINGLSFEYIEYLLSKDIQSFRNLLDSDAKYALRMKALSISETMSKINRTNLQKETAAIETATDEAKDATKLAEEQYKALQEITAQTKEATEKLKVELAKARQETEAMVKDLEEKSKKVTEDIEKLAASKAEEIPNKLKELKDKITADHTRVFKQFNDNTDAIIKKYKNDISDKIKDIEEKQLTLGKLVTNSLSKAGQDITDKAVKKGEEALGNLKDTVENEISRAVKQAEERLQEEIDKLIKEKNDLQKDLSRKAAEVLEDLKKAHKEAMEEMGKKLTAAIERAAGLESERDGLRKKLGNITAGEDPKALEAQKKLQKEIDKLEKENARILNELGKMPVGADEKTKKEQKALEEEIGKLKGENAELKKKLSALPVGDDEKAKNAQKALQGEIDKLKEENAELSKKLSAVPAGEDEKAKLARETLQNELAKLKGEKTELEKQIADAKKAAENAALERAELEAKLNAAELQAKKAKEELEALKGADSTAKNEALDKLKKAEERVLELEAAIGKQKAELEKKNADKLLELQNKFDAAKLAAEQAAELAAKDAAAKLLELQNKFDAAERAAELAAKEAASKLLELQKQFAADKLVADRAAEQAAKDAAAKLLELQTKFDEAKLAAERAVEQAAKDAAAKLLELQTKFDEAKLAAERAAEQAAKDAAAKLLELQNKFDAAKLAAEEDAAAKLASLESKLEGEKQTIANELKKTKDELTKAEARILTLESELELLRDTLQETKEISESTKLSLFKKLNMAKDAGAELGMDYKNAKVRLDSIKLAIEKLVKNSWVGVSVGDLKKLLDILK